MKKVRFETLDPRNNFNRMDDSDCHSPRPFIERQASNYMPEVYQYKPVVYSNDPVHRFEYSDSSPYPLAKKTVLSTNCDIRPSSYPSNELNLSMLDFHNPRTPCRPTITERLIDNRVKEPTERLNLQPVVLTSLENKVSSPNVLSKEDSFFIRRDNLNKYFLDTNLVHVNDFHLGKENSPQSQKSENKRTETSGNQHFAQNHPIKINQPQQSVSPNNIGSYCNCHHCKRVFNLVPCVDQLQESAGNQCHKVLRNTGTAAFIPQSHCYPLRNCLRCEEYIQKVHSSCNCSSNPQNTMNKNDMANKSPRNAIDKKAWAIERYEKSKNSECLEVERQSNISKEKKEPTISDLLKIIKLQNEQLQLLQEKVDKFISVSTTQQQAQPMPVQNFMREHVALQTIDSEHKISIGVMTSFEMVRTSTVINKEILTQTNDNAQIQCNRSQISIKEVVSKQPVNLNFLDGIMPVGRIPQPHIQSTNESVFENAIDNNPVQLTANMNDEKTLNEQSLYNVQVDNATTPLMSPEQSLYLDVRDYSDSDSSSDQSNVGWTYYNKVMTHVNGMLQDSDMPSSASALYRNTRQQCLQMQIDKTNVSVTKRVKFGDDPLGVRQPHIYATATDTSLKMNQLAAKYLKQTPLIQRAPKHNAQPVDMSFATRNYMEKHKLIQGVQNSSRPPPAPEMPRFLDITALKQQPKLL